MTYKVICPQKNIPHFQNQRYINSYYSTVNPVELPYMYQYRNFSQVPGRVDQPEADDLD